VFLLPAVQSTYAAVVAIQTGSLSWCLLPSFQSFLTWILFPKIRTWNWD